MSKVLELKNISVGYENNPIVLKKVNLTVYEKDFLGIIGPNGGGKTTILKTILGLKKQSSGSITYYKKKLEIERINIGYLPQTSLIDRKFPISVYDTILSGISTKRQFFYSHTKENKERVEEIVHQMGLNHLINEPIGTLSGGQFQRTLLGRAIIDNPDLLILDEPNSYVDKNFESSFYKILEKINENTAIIMVSHDVGTVLSLVKNIACVNAGLHYHKGSNISTEWLNQTYNCPIDIVGHGEFPHRVLETHTGCECCDKV